MHTENEQTHSDRMSHPSSEEWMTSLYGELSPGDAARLTAHLEECPDCSAKMKRWESAKTALDDFALPKPRPQRGIAAPLVKWGIAAMLLFGLGLGLGHVLSPAPANAAAMRASILAEVNTEMTAKLDAYKQAAAEQRSSDNQAILVALRQMESARVADFISLRKDLETMAVLTQSGLQQTQRELVSLANYSKPDFRSPEQ